MAPTAPTPPPPVPLVALFACKLILSAAWCSLAAATALYNVGGLGQIPNPIKNLRYMSEGAR